MNTRLLMRGSAVFLGVLGLSATFLPLEILAHAGVTPGGVNVVLVQVAGGLYLGFAFLNWMAQGNAIGGIYSRPVAIGNLSHFMIGGLALFEVRHRGPAHGGDVDRDRGLRCVRRLVCPGGLRNPARGRRLSIDGVFGP